MIKVFKLVSIFSCLFLLALQSTYTFDGVKSWNSEQLQIDNNIDKSDQDTDFIVVDTALLTPTFLFENKFSFYSFYINHLQYKAGFIRAPPTNFV